MDNKQSGMTLVEVLATLVLSSLVMIIIWTTVSISMKYSATETKKLHLQQEANYIITKIQQVHRQSDCYRLEIKKDFVIIRKCEDNSQSQEAISTGFSYAPETEATIKPKEKDLDISNFTVHDRENNKLQIKVNMFISRYKTN